MRRPFIFSTPKECTSSHAIVLFGCVVYNVCYIVYLYYCCLQVNYHVRSTGMPTTVYLSVCLPWRFSCVYVACICVLYYICHCIAMYGMVETANHVSCGHLMIGYHVMIN